MIISALAIAIASLLLGALLLSQVARLRRRLAAVPKDGDVVGLLRGIDTDLATVEATVADLAPRVDKVERFMPSAISRTGVVAYDAFDNISGNQSRSIALLNAHGDGIVISLLVSRNDTLFFTKEVRKRNGVEPLSPEEEAAVAEAFAG